MARSELINNLGGNTTNFIPNALVVDTRLSMGARLLFVYLAGQSNKFQFSNENIATELGIGSNNTISKYMTELVVNGWIIKSKLPSGYDSIELCPTSRTITTKEDILNSINSPKDLKEKLALKICGYQFAMFVAENELLEVGIKNGNFYYLDDKELELPEETQNRYWEFLFENRLQKLLDWLEDQNNEITTKKKKKVLKIPKGKMTKEQKLEQSEREKSAYVWELKKAMFESDKIRDFLYKIGINGIEEWKEKTQGKNPYTIDLKNGSMTIQTEEVLVPWQTHPQTIFSIVSKKKESLDIEDVEIIE